MTMIDEMQSPEIAEISKALAQFQQAMPVLEKTGANFQKGKAADLGDIVTVARIGAKFGLSFSQPIVSIVKEQSKSEYFVQTFVRHITGQWISGGIMPILPEKTGMGNFGAALTYSKKYSLQSVLGIADYNEVDLDDEYSLLQDDENAGSDSLKSGSSGGGDASRSSENASGSPPQPSIQEQILAASDMKDLQEIWNREGMTTNSEEYQAFADRVDELNGKKEK